MYIGIRPLYQWRFPLESRHMVAPKNQGMASQASTMCPGRPEVGDRWLKAGVYGEYPLVI